MLDPITIINLVNPLALKIVRAAIKGLGIKYSVDVDYVINESIKLEFQKCVDVAIKAFIQYILKKLAIEDFNKQKQKLINDYFESPQVIEEIWHLLDPGVEFFDRGLLTKIGYDYLSSEFKNLKPQFIFEAWDEFLKAFSFASRSTPEFREFLRASYEAGSFRTLSNIEDVLERMNNAIGSIQKEEITAREAIDQYAIELKNFRNWAINFK